MATSKPGKPTCNNETHNTVNVRWTHPEYGQENIQSYIVVASLMDDCSSDCTSFSKVQFPKLSTTVAGLIPKSKYCFKIIPELRCTSHGMESDSSNPVETSPACQTSKPVAKKVTHNSILLTWEKPRYRSDQIKRYRVICQSLSMQHQAKAIRRGANQKEIETKSTETSILVSNLVLDSEYVFRVVPVSTIPEVIAIISEESGIIRTRAASVPHNLKFGTVAHNFIQIKWSKPKSRIASPPISSYCVSYLEEADALNYDLQWKNKNTADSAETQLTVENLQDATRYAFKVCARYDNEAYCGTESDAIAIETKPSCKPGQVLVTYISHNSIHLQWTKPAHFESKIVHYKVSSHTLSHFQTVQWNLVQTECLGNELAINNLETNTGYVFKVEPVCSSSKIVTQSTQSCSIFTKATSKPGTPTAKAVYHNKIDLVWEMPLNGSRNINSYIVYYHLTKETNDAWQQQELDGCQTCMTVRGLSLKTTYIFKVFPKCANGEGTESDESVPIQTKATSPPSKPEVTKTTHNSVSLCWKRPEYGSANVKDYTVQYSSDSLRGTNFKSIMVTAQEIVTVPNLATKTKYLFRIISNCETGVGSESENSDLIETKPSCKTGVPEVTIMTHESVLLKWTKPDYQSDKIKWYHISYWQIDIPNSTIECNTDGVQESVTIQGLCHNTKYEFKVNPACWDSEVGTESNVSAVITTKATSNPGIPHATAITHTSIRLEWNKPDYGSDLIKSYIVFCRLKNSKKWEVQETDGQQEKITFERLQINESYVFKVKTQCIQGDGSESDVSDTVTTRAISPPGKPTATYVTHDSVQLEWSPPDGTDNLSAYTVFYCSVDNLKQDSEWKMQETSQTSLNITGLTINTKYVFKIKPVCKHGLIGTESDLSDWIETKATSKPGTPHVISTTSNTAQLEWSRPEHGSENITLYIIHFSFNSKTWQQYETDAKHNKATVIDLHAKREYCFRVEPVCNSGCSSSSDISNSYCTKGTSPPGMPEAIHVSHNSIQLKWSKPEHGSENVDHYIISCCVEKGPEDWNKREWKTNGAKETFELSNKFKPGRSYAFTVRSECTGSVKGMESKSCQPIVTKIISPPGKPTAISNEITCNTISLQWTKPQVGYEYVKYFSVHYKQLDTLCSIQASRDSTAITVSQLTPKTKYIFKVEPVCELAGMGSESDCSDVIVTKPASKPGKPVYTFVSHNSVSLKWDKPEYGSEGVVHYTVLYHVKNRLATEKQEKKGTLECSIQIQDLSPCTEYVFMVRPEFGDTQSGTVADCSDPSYPVETKATSQPGKPEADFVTHDSVQLRWTEPEIQYGKNNIVQYSVQYRQLQGSDWVSQKTTHVQETVSGLAPGRMYEFKVYAICKQGEGSESETSAVQTKSTSPLSRPSPGTVSHSSIQLKWTKPRIGAGEVVSYFVFYRIADTKSQHWAQKCTNCVQETIIIDNLTLNTTYDIYVEPQCRNSVGSTSETISVKTKSTSQPGKPSAVLVSLNEIHLKWTKPDHGGQNISGYIVSYHSTADQQGQWTDSQLQIKPNTESAIVPGLTPGTKYVFKLLPQCKNGEGAESETSDPIETKVTSKPGTPEAYDIVHNSLSLRWTEPEHGANLVVGYVVLYKEATLDSTSADWKWQDSDINDTVVGGLTPGKKYIFKIEPKCQAGVGAKSDTSDPVETRSTSPPGKPTVSEINGSVTHDSISICWTSPTYGAKNVEGYTIYYRIRDDFPENWTICKVHSFNILSQTVNKLQAKTKYIFKVSSTCSSGIGAESECSEPIETKPSCKPGKPEAADDDITHESITLKWSKPDYGKVKSYTVNYKKKGFLAQWKQESTTQNSIKLDQLKHSTEYQIHVYPEIEPENGIGIQWSETNIIKTKNIPLAERMKAKSRLIERGKSGFPDVYRVQIQTVREDHKKMIRKCFVGEDTIKRNTTFNSGKVIMLVGATGTGKTTLINGLVNYVLGVKWEHSYRFKMIVEESQVDQTKSQTKWITSYTIQAMEESPIKYPLTIIDTPGFGDTEGIERDQRLVEQIRAFFCTKGDGGIDQIHVIGFVTQSGLARLTHLQKYIFHSVMSVFGKDVQNNIFMMITFADGELPPVLKTVSIAGVPYHKSFKFNNSALFANNVGANTESDSPSNLMGKMFWEMGATSFKQFSEELSRITPKSLVLTKEVLEEREHLEVCVEGLQQQVRVGLMKIDALRQEEDILKKHDAQLRENKEFTYTIKVTKQRKIDLVTGEHVTNCLTCNHTCHYPCYIPKDEDKHSCAAMGDKRHTPEAECTTCPGKCRWNMHVNNPYRFEIYQEDETKTSDDLKKRYRDAKGGKMHVENMIAKLNQELDAWYKEVLQTIHRTHRSLKRLQEIALKPNPLTEVGYIELLIESEKQEAEPGYLQRIQSLEKLKEKVKLLQKLPPERFNPNSSGSGAKPWEGLISELKETNK